MACHNGGDGHEPLVFITNQSRHVAAQLHHLYLNPAAFHIAKSLLKRLILSLDDVLPELLAKDINTVEQFFLGLSIANEVWEFSRETIVVVTVLVHAALLIASAS